ncbi:MAG TPA: Crp/Fnr family transcriptional regulator [Xanthobacteraceae bacterium]|nr:Crp/Fnr family transcriptional regulator [Xanthobacteraceae bacterium]
MNIYPGAVTSGLTGNPLVARLKHYIDLDDDDLESLRGLIEGELTVKKRRDLVVDGYEFRKLCFICDGFAARYKLLRNGKRQILNVLLPGDVIGLPGSFLERANYSVIAITDMRIQVCALDAYVQLCYRRPKFGLALSWLAVMEAALYAEHIIDTGRRTPLERLARFLLELHARLDTVGRAGPSGFELPFSQEVLGDALGLSVPHLNRMFAQLRAEGLITINNHRVDFTNPKGLQVLGHFQPLNLARIPPPNQKQSFL